MIIIKMVLLILIILNILIKWGIIYKKIIMKINKIQKMMINNKKKNIKRN